ncbi:hypothetical protein HYPSUDRAFT_481349 [Hypholoma sublateritium FD-334 SS-4]|uniref:Uncharacterized protein n=1 Tax=Hypholoma sublateritium (strain FD-334 SS-4) TaxID=945553 RepID=A0A0D2PZ52_HYPSF|nr:hypothetical protein HYPSUDRAFT_481349 [Hypholoma sublateritium FD-334 SS-4]
MEAPQALVKQAKKDLIREAKDEEKNIKAASKDLSRTEKAEQKAYKEVVKADAKLEKAENLKQDGFNEIAPGQVHQAQIDFELSSQKYAQIHYAKEEMEAHIDAAMQVNDERTRERNVKLNALSGPSALNEASRFIPVTENQAARTSVSPTRNRPC